MTFQEVSGGGSVDGTDISPSSVDTDRIQVQTGTFGAEYTHYIISRSGTYYAVDDQGVVVASNSTPDLGAQINSLAPSAISSVSDRQSLKIQLEPEKIFNAATEITINNGTRFALHGAPRAGSTIKWTGSESARVIHYDGDNSFQNADIGNRNNQVDLRNFEINWGAGRDTDVIQIWYANTLKAHNLLLRDRTFDLTDRIKQNENVSNVPSGNWTAFADVTGGLSEHRRISDSWVVGAARAYNITGDHALMHNLQAFYCNPPTGKPVFAIGTDSGGNDRLLMNCHAYECGEEQFKVNGSANDRPYMLIGCVAEDEPPNGYNAQTGFLHNTNGVPVVVVGYAVANSNQTHFAGDTSSTAVFNHDNIKVPNGGPNGTGVVEFSNARLYEDTNGEIVAEDSGGNTTTIS